MIPGEWRDHPKLKGRFHESYPDDLQVMAHDGGPRLTDSRPEFGVGESDRVHRGCVSGPGLESATPTPNDRRGQRDPVCRSTAR